LKKVIFMGTPDYAGAILQSLVSQSDIEVVAVYTQPDKPVGRKRIMTPPVVKTIACANDIKVYQPEKLREKDVVQELLKIKCDFIIVAAYGQILPKDILNHAPCINLHASVLPQYRGASPIQQTLLNADKESGITAMLMDEGLDTGDIVKIEKIKVGDDVMAEELFEKLTVLACEVSIDVIKNFKNYTPIKQDDSIATYCKKITKADGEVEFDDAQVLYNKYRAFTPWPGIYLKSGLKLKNIKLADNVSFAIAGQIVKIENNSITVSCKKGSVEIFSVQAPSKKEVSVISYINGKRLKVEDYFS